MRPFPDVSVAEDGDGAAWDSFVRARRPDGHFLAWPWRRVIRRSLGHEPVYLIARRGDAVVGVLPLFDVRSRLFGRALVSVPFLNGGGLLSADEPAARALLDAAGELVRRRGVAYCELRARHPEPVAAADDWLCRSHKVAMRLPLGDDPERLLRGFGAKLRSQIRRPAKAGARAVASSGESVAAAELAGFYAVFAENMRDLGTPVYPIRLFRETLEAFGSAAWLVTVWLEDRPAAGGLTVGFGDSAEMIWASSLRRYNALSVNMLLYWEAMRCALAAGHTSFDFGRSSPGGPTYRFKRQWGAVPQALHWYYRLGAAKAVPDVSPDNPKYRLAVRLWRSMPLPLANRLGPLIAPSLP